MGLKIGATGVGQFAPAFIRLFQTHPAVDEVVLAEILPERRAAQAQRFGIARTFASHEELCKSVLDFIESMLEEKLPPNNVWFAARCCVPGIVAHESARRGGELLKIPDFGEPAR